MNASPAKRRLAMNHTLQIVRFFKRLGKLCAVLPLCGLLLAVNTAVSASTLENDPLVASARLAEANGNYPDALDYYKKFLQSNPDSTLSSQVMTRISVLQEAIRHGDNEEALALFLEALDMRAVRDVEGAGQKLVAVLEDYPGSYLSDDAIYLQGYIAMMDAYQYEKAHALFRRLKNEYPDSSYIDTALYSEAISLEQLGNTKGCLLYTSPSPRDQRGSRMPSSA